MNRTLLILGTTALAVLAVAFVACSSGSDSAEETNRDGADDGLGVAAACVEGTVDCQDTIVIGEDDLPSICADDATAPECLDEEPPLEPELPPGALPYDVTVDFDETSVDEAMDSVLAILQSADPTAEIVILERFPPAAAGTIHSVDGEFCAVLVEQLMDIPGVADVSCREAGTDVPIDPDEPVSSS